MIFSYGYYDSWYLAMRRMSRETAHKMFLAQLYRKHTRMGNLPPRTIAIKAINQPEPRAPIHQPVWSRNRWKSLT